jgi:hypothetical protein
VQNLPVAVEFFLARHSGNFGTFLPVGITIIYDANGSVDVLKKFSQMLGL